MLGFGGKIRRKLRLIWSFEGLVERIDRVSGGFYPGFRARPDAQVSALGPERR